MELSERLQATVDLLDAGLRVADIGTDHGYIPIYLTVRGKVSHVIAMDINEGPLLRAKTHILEHGLSGQIEVRQSDGVQALDSGECDAVIAAGMGGALIIRIMEEGQEIFENLRQFILQPQSELEKVRQYLWKQEYDIIEEDMVLEDGKFYTMMKAGKSSGEKGGRENYRTIDFRYGKRLLERRHPVLRLFLEKEIQTKEQILTDLKKESGEHIELRRKELRQELAEAYAAIRLY